MGVPPRVPVETGRIVEEGDWEMERIVSLRYLSSSLPSLSARAGLDKRRMKMKNNNILNILAIKYN